MSNGKKKKVHNIEKNSSKIRSKGFWRDSYPAVFTSCTLLIITPKSFFTSTTVVSFTWTHGYPGRYHIWASFATHCGHVTREAMGSRSVTERERCRDPDTLRHTGWVPILRTANGHTQTQPQRQTSSGAAQVGAQMWTHSQHQSHAGTQ